MKNKEEGELKLQMLSQFAAGTSAAAVCSSVKKCKVKERERTRGNGETNGSHKSSRRQMRQGKPARKERDKSVE